MSFDSDLTSGEPAEKTWRDECGVVGVWAPGEPVSGYCFLALFALQHRGQESAGIAVTDGVHIDLEKGLGLMREAFKDRTPSLKGHAAVGHVRYSSLKNNLFADIQPCLAAYSNGLICLAHNGSLTNASALKAKLLQDGCTFQTNVDAEIILNLMVNSQEAVLEERVVTSLKQLDGAYSLTMMTGQKLIGARDPYGFRPLCLGRTPGGGHILASESCALDAIGATFVRDVEPGEMVVIDQNGLTSIHIDSRPGLAHCVFEHIYFARPDSVIDGLSVWQARHQMGQQLAREFKGQVDLVAPVPDTGIAAALGFAFASGLPYIEGLIKNRYVGRTFILPDQKDRQNTVSMKLNPIRANLEGKRVALVDDSLVRGTTSAKLISLIRQAGAKEVHFCISSPPITHPCRYGIDTAGKTELIAAIKSMEDIRLAIGADGLHYLSSEGLLASVNDPQGRSMCTACFSGRYPTPVEGLDD